ncbi:hypothetical protein EUGRSUZ_C03849 [Eucalyptus grandis]|uniref:Uncharacterized protein n=2 Tax=Eucalyptus grandis TaxID=71139 RepID=A0A059CVT9_EUCGR|nr:hypothetical protein EUGRSUZ_C03849 [Eucalyptus grandis]
MCHPRNPLLSLKDRSSMLRRRYPAHALGATRAADQDVGNARMPAAAAAAAGGTAGAGADGLGSKRRCLCSPTLHPGSFRCRHHRAEYAWGGAMVRKRPEDMYKL